jgi:hypothetical protein
LQAEHVEFAHGSGIQDAGLPQAFGCLVHGLQNLSCHFHYTSISISSPAITAVANAAGE